MITKDEYCGRIRTVRAQHGEFSAEVVRTFRTDEEVAEGAEEKAYAITLRQGNLEATPDFVTTPGLGVLVEALSVLGLCNPVNA